MAKTGAEAGGHRRQPVLRRHRRRTSGLPPDYAIIGNVTEGLDVVDAIGQFGDPADPAGTATKVVVIEKATVTESLTVRRACFLPLLALVPVLVLAGCGGGSRARRAAPR